ncbi:hypothetical protein TrST_g9528 [Triparma strigata]|uniref:Glycosyl transferase CAP10 domain-containing protein n=1 Tax=Triparma strigata TaxID=1606541 RepID=A0A9W7EEX8_9STRA|nr:hypothetical protein TrST_g9528 [Triparma strigata]
MAQPTVDLQTKATSSFHTLPKPPQKDALDWYSCRDAKWSEPWAKTPNIVGDLDLAECRHFRFPSVQERVKYYMGSWGGDKVMDVDLSSLNEKYCNYSIPVDKVFYAYVDNIEKCKKGEGLSIPALKFYCDDAYPFMATDSEEDEYNNPYVLFQFGDSAQAPRLPLILKARQIHSTVKPILWPLNSHRHFDGFKTTQRDDVAWKEKDPRLVWRGAATGVQGGKPNNHRVSRIDVVRRYSSSPGIDVGFTESFGEAKHLEKAKISKKELLKHKYLLSMEGNDIASGLKWMLLSNSVVFMAKPEHESWAMEAYLIPFVHFVPLNDDMSNLEEMIEWSQEHDKECLLIAQRATWFMEDLWVSEEARTDNAAVKFRMKKEYNTKYQSLIETAAQKCNSDSE